MASNPSKRVCNNILEAIGHTPLVRLNSVTKGVPATVYAKVETFNPGNSIKDRMALKMVEDAEKAGILKPGGTIIEGTSGNTGMGLAIAAIVKGYKCIFTTTDKQSKEKVDALKAYGADVIVCPTNVEPEDPRSYYSVAKRLNKEIPNSFYPNQYDNLSNSQAHYEQTGPEIWEQTEGKITHLLVGAGTGGTITGTGRYLKEKNPNVKIWGIDTYGSALKKYHETGVLDKNEIYPYVTEGIGEDFIPLNYDFKIIDHFEKVTDKDAALMTRELCRQEGIWVGNSAGSAIAGLLQLKDQLKPTDVVVVIFHDHGSRYLAKMFNDDWMRKMGYLDTSGMTAQDLVASRKSIEVVTIDKHQPISAALKLITENNYSQIPVTSEDRIVGTIYENTVFNSILKNPAGKSATVESIMKEAMPFVDITTTVHDLSTMVSGEREAVLVKDFKAGRNYIITKSDIAEALAR
ncbi:MAG: pyridoxal-phosphate dependent enzyme [Bacteroidota bacterium]|jgi:cystathionine beta-synthase|uniref:pyridoxal-phosphate dependent enzyme n=1 Tax=Candidatus Pollutiaquabacter sp. TaxID=3416354 RepID=UPI001A4B5B4F|nr:pyridoxal-phosphate dependent enzyme [Bacteroidota bacterium]MBL7947771.1 pyridoxal-phosphate dependent enzyme [Bacteroidia bacterium]MBP6010364.1 pyridoxal-phosphate dependent enzyme [Bacteroidia bacterium]MBP7270055.1 pyridoxal-phosphate dependent enzyme [Bacteroidia bacterium]MBP7436384.1 pyridoxal-phosphate dependent enzyme [Bacteroidia bacterium]